MNSKLIKILSETIVGDKYSFKVDLELGNDAMQSAEDIADALRDIAKKLEKGISDGKIMDKNGNTVGIFG